MNLFDMTDEFCEFIKKLLKCGVCVCLEIEMDNMGIGFILAEV